MEITWPYDADAHWNFTLKLAGPLADAIGALDGAEQEEIRLEVRSQIEPLIAAEGGVTGLVHVVSVA